MALLDVKRYFLEVEGQYLEMYNQVKEFEERKKEGKMSTEQLEILKDNVDTMKCNYERLAYVMYLLNLPKSTKKRNKFKKNDLEDKFEYIGANKRVVIDENSNVLTNLKELFKDINVEKEEK